MKPENKNFLTFCLLVFLTAVLAYSLFFVSAMAYSQPMGSYSKVSSYVHGFILHMPLWLGALLIAGLILKKPFPRKMTLILEALLFGLLLLPLILKDPRVFFDYIVLPYYAVDFLLCLALLLKLRIRLIKT
ncbi:hypothetical protein AAEO56_13210 [Flavobacterium sp. DGU11]|uniref:Uncharacterized protein n=1 Tax=Flavobacterium arundinis TaxID=3139143 RepID=A0ABU9HZN3_9FLAO